jgi:hypothetical protein
VRCFCFCGIYKQGRHGHAIARGPRVWELDVGLSTCPKKIQYVSKLCMWYQTWTDPLSALKQQKVAM